MTVRLASRIGLCTTMAFAPAAAQAHLVSTRFGDFYGGMLHPLTALGHLLPWLALGLLAGLHEVRSGRWVLLALPAGLLFGILLSRVPPDLTLVPGVNVVSFVLLGALVAFAWHLPTSALVALGAVLGSTHGYQNGLGLTEQSNVVLFVAGVTVAGYVVVTLVTAFALVFSRRTNWGRVAVRAAGSWIAAVGIMMVSLRHTLG